MQLTMFRDSISLDAQRIKNLIFDSIAAISSLYVFHTVEKGHLGCESWRDFGQSTPRLAACSVTQPLLFM